MITENEVLSYLKQWIDEEKWDDFAIMYINGETEMLADAVVSSGAICPDECYPEFQKMELEVIKYAKRFRKLSIKKRNKIYKDVFKESLIVTCDDCNATSYVHSNNEELYPELLTNCRECRSKNIQKQKG